MSTESETGWSKEWPGESGYYWRRINEHDYPSLVRIVGESCRFTDGSSEGRYECYEFLGPLTPALRHELVPQDLIEATRGVITALRHALSTQEVK
jgi:hypothetical protein